MAMIPPHRLFGNTPSVSVPSPANMAILIKIEAIVCLPVHVGLGHCPCCVAVALSNNKEREKRQRPKDQGDVEPGRGRSATVASHVIRCRHRGYRNQLNDQPHRHGRLRNLPPHHNTEPLPDAGAPQKVRPPPLREVRFPWLLPKRQARNAQGQIHAKLTFDRERLQRNRAMRTTDQHIGAQANP